MDELLQEFIAETREMLEAMQGELVTWEADPADRERLDTIFRFVHTVKGNCGFFDLPRIEALAHAAESTLADLRAEKRAPDELLVSAILAIIDRIVAMVDAIDAGEEFPESGDEVLIRMLGAENGHSIDFTEPDTGKQAVAGLGEPSRNAVKLARSIRLPVALLDRVMAGMSDMVLVRNELSRSIRDTGGDRAASAIFERLSGIVDDVREGVSRMRMQRLEYLFATFPRIVRDLSSELGKRVHIETEGGDVELDREMIELLRDPLMHMLRNAIDHGIERSAERREAGKNEAGVIRISARQSGNSIAISIIDDGRGIDTRRLADKAVAEGIITAAERAALSAEDCIALIFQPGLSTAAKVTAVSGRGVGMDVVRENVEGFGGRIKVVSDAGKGTSQTIILPATLSIVPALTVKVGGQNFGVPRSCVEEIVSGGSSALEFDKGGDTQLVRFRGEHLRCVSLAKLFGLDANHDPCSGAVLIIRLTTGELFGLAVEHVIDHQELVIKKLPPAISGTELYTGSSLLDDGSLVLMLFIAGIARREGLVNDIGTQARKSITAQRSEGIEKQETRALLVVGLDGQRLIVRMDQVCRIEAVESSAIRMSEDSARVVIDGKIYPLAGHLSSLPRSGDIDLLRLSDETHHVAYAIRSVIDTVKITNAIVADKTKSEIEGVTLLDGEAIEVLDCHWLFSRYDDFDFGQATKTCQLDDSDPWTRSILRPLVEAAGYTIVPLGAEHSADVAIVSGENGATPDQAGRVITLTSDPAAATNNGGMIYRYDHEGLLASLVASKRKAS
ncbi:chemotaxis protein CheA [Altererythrobacter aquiaggeris]|uniref:chemotaxis protein CheA n=1 Tax=Aestuarierythrobacter aquiaggeris TaxID=1898396 RepID=UPI00301A1335